jgi:hypothetical protein
MQCRLNQQGFLRWCVAFLLTLTLWSLGGGAIAAPHILATNPVSNRIPKDVAPLATGREVFETAYNERYTWDENFPGYQAEVSVNDGGKIEQGLVRVTPDLEVSVLNISDKDIRDLVKEQLQMEVIHRKSVPFDRRHENSTFELEEIDELGAAKIKEMGEKSNPSYKVQDNQIVQVNRSFDDVALTVDVVGTIKTPEGFLPIHTQTVYRDADTGEILQQNDVRDFYEKIGGYYLLTNRTIRRSKEGNPELQLTPDTTIRFNDVQPL